MTVGVVFPSSMLPPQFLRPTANIETRLDELSESFARQVFTSMLRRFVSARNSASLRKLVSRVCEYGTKIDTLFPVSEPNTRNPR
jgi:hypothetical protein